MDTNARGSRRYYLEYFMVNILNRIDHLIEKSRPVYVHCWGGRGRMGTLIVRIAPRNSMDSLLNPIIVLRLEHGF